MNARARLAVGGAFALAAAGLVGLAASAVSLGRMPGRGFDLRARGLIPQASLADARFVVDPARATAWAVTPGAVCALDLKAARVTRCRATASRRKPARALAAGGVLLVVEDDPASATDAVAFRFAILDAAGKTIAEGMLGSSPWPHGAAPLNIAWVAGAFSVGFVVRGPDGGLVRVPVSVAGKVGEPARAPAGPDPVVAVFGGDPPRALLARRVMREGARETPLPVDPAACLGAASLGCVVVQGDAPRGDARSLAAYVTAEGRVVAARDLIGAEVGAEPRLFGVASSASAAEPRVAALRATRASVPLADGSTAVLEARAGEGETLILARGTGAAHAIARGRSSLEAWRLLPFVGGALAIDVEAARAVVLGDELRPIDPPAPGLVALGRERFAGADLDVKAWLLAWASVIPIAAVAARRPASWRRIALIAVWGALVVALLIARRAAFFSP